MHFICKILECIPRFHFLCLYQNNIQKMSIYVGLSLTNIRGSNVVRNNGIFYGILYLWFQPRLSSLTITYEKA